MTSLLAPSSAATVAGLCVVSAWVAARRGARPGIRPYALIMLLFAAAATFSGARLTLALTWLSHVLVLASILIFAIATWVVLVFRYTGRGPALTRNLLVLVFGFAILTITSPVLTFLMEGEPPVLVFTNVLTQTFVMGALVYGALLVAISARQYDDLSTGGVALLSTIALGLILYIIVRFTGEAGLLDTTGEFWGMIGLLGVLAGGLLGIQVRYRPFASDPSTGYLAREAVLDWVDEAILIGDRENRLFDFNTTARSLFGIDGSRALGRPIPVILGIGSDDLREPTVELDSRVGRRRFDVTRLSLGGDTRLGRAFRLRDVTNQRTHKEQLEVLNRVLRHNLRNDLDAIHAFAKALERQEAGTEDAADFAARIDAIATDLADLCEKIAQTEQLLADDSVDSDPLDVVVCVRGLAEAVDDAAMTLETPDEPVRVQTDERLLRAALEELLANAVAHNDHETPHVAVSVRRTRDDGVAIDIADNGPGIPEQEREILLEGEETPLRHGSGVGLWMVHWAVRQLGGTVTVAENDPRGSVVTLSFDGFDAVQPSGSEQQRPTSTG